MRGQDGGLECVRWCHGITPADAGTSQGNGCSTGIPADHPRGCGDKRGFWMGATGQWGSPPRMRGQEGTRGSGSPYARITPADAGTSPAGSVPLPSSGDHPRGCGDKPLMVFFSPSIGGSPPRMRGQAKPRDDSGWGPRITPADAGASQVSMMRFAALADHPRGCGDKLLIRRHLTFFDGSPPRMRGQGRYAGP